MNQHPTEIFLHNPQGLRVAYDLGEGRLRVWWSPFAGRSTAARDRNFSNRDEHLEVFARIGLPDCPQDTFVACDYDPYHSVVRFKEQTLHIALRPDAAALLLWAESNLRVDLASDRYDDVMAAEPRRLVLRHTEPAHTFGFAATLGAGTGTMRHSPFRGQWTRHYTEVQLAPGQVLVLGVGVDGEGIEAQVGALAAIGIEEHLRVIDATLSPHEAMGRTSGGTGCEGHAFRTALVRGLHSMIDESGAFRASLKAIYYLIWVRDASFAFAYQAAAGWPHKLPELCRLLLDNPTVARGEGIPVGRMFAQLIHPDYGKYEEDGLYYVLWAIFTHWTQSGQKRFVEGADFALLEEALTWVEARAFDNEAGLFGGYFADETPAFGSRDYRWDHAIGQPVGDDHIQHDGHRVIRSYDVYLNTLMHSVYTMLAALCEDEAMATALTEKAERLWERMRELYADRRNGLPPYGDLLCEDGKMRRAHHWGPATSIHIWALAMPNFLPLEDRDTLHGALLDAILEKPEMHWINGICAAVAAADPWVHGEERLHVVLERVRVEAMTAGAYLPMGGAMPEKMGAPQGNLYHDIRPQGFAMAAWLGAWASLGVRRLPHGLTLRPTKIYNRLENYPWRGSLLHFVFGPVSRSLALEIGGKRIEHTLQVPTDAIAPGEQTVRLVEAKTPGRPLLLRSSVELLSVEGDEGGRILYRIRGYGRAEMVLADLPADASLMNAQGEAIPLDRFDHPDRSEIRFCFRGTGVLIVGGVIPKVVTHTQCDLVSSEK